MAKSSRCLGLLTVKLCYFEVPVSNWFVTISYLRFLKIHMLNTHLVYVCIHLHILYTYGGFTTYELGCNPKYEAIKPGIPTRSHTHVSFRACDQCVPGPKVGQRMHHTLQPATRTDPFPITEIRTIVYALFWSLSWCNSRASTWTQRWFG